MRISIKKLRQIIREEVNRTGDQDGSVHVPWAEEARRLDGEIRKAREEYAGWYENMKSKPDWYQPRFLEFFEIPAELRGRKDAALIRSKMYDIEDHDHYSDTTEGQQAKDYLEPLVDALDAHWAHVESISDAERAAFGQWAMDNRPDLVD